MSKNEEEKQEIVTFLTALDFAPLKNLNLDSERPDALLTNGKVLGIEHTRVFQPETETGLKIQHQESIRDKVISDAWKSYIEESNMNNLHVSVSFEDHYWVNIPKEEFSGADIKTLSKSLLEVVMSNIPDKGKVFELYKYAGDDLPKGLMTVTIVHSEKGGAVGWFRNTGGIVPHISSEHIQDIINSKNGKVKEYKHKCDEAWLLIVANNRSYRRSVIIDENVLKSRYEIHLNRAFIMEIDFATLVLNELVKSH